MINYGTKAIKSQIHKIQLKNNTSWRELLNSKALEGKMEIEYIENGFLEEE